MCDKETKEAVPVTAFLNADRLAKDIEKINDAARGRGLSVFGVTLALLRNYNPFTAAHALQAQRHDRQVR